MYKMLIVEDDPTIADEVAAQIAPWGIEAKKADDLRNVMQVFAKFQPHIVLLDISLPFFNGYHWCEQIRAVSKVPVIFISSASDNMNIVMAMNLGADDFVSKPFDMNVLTAKVRALLRRTYDFGASVPLLEHKGAILNTGDGSLSVNGEKVSLSKNEYRILLCLMENKGKTVSREKLMERLWQTDQFIDENTLTVNVNRLRKNSMRRDLPTLLKQNSASATSLTEPL